LHTVRTTRLQLAIPLFVYGNRETGSPFNEITETIVVNARGGLIGLSESVIQGQLLLVLNMKTGRGMKCTVAYVKEDTSGKRHVGIAFDEPYPRFWGVVSPPGDWGSEGPKLTEIPRKPN
jgi:hypothetical protein